MSTSRMDPRSVRLEPERGEVEPVGIGDIRAQAAAEAQTSGDRRRIAKSTGTVARAYMPKRLSREAEELRVAAKVAEREQMIEDRIDREACTWCGVRADVGCKHRRAV